LCCLRLVKVQDSNMHKLHQTYLGHPCRNCTGAFHSLALHISLALHEQSKGQQMHAG